MPKLQPCSVQASSGDFSILTTLLCYRYKALDRLDSERTLLLLQHLGFVHCPKKEHCPTFPNCMDCLIEKIIANKAAR